MSLFSSIIQPMLEKELKAIEPEIAQFLLTQLKKVATEVLEWAETKVNIDLNNDGSIGETNETR